MRKINVTLMKQEQYSIEKTVDELKGQLKILHNRTNIAGYKILNRILKLRRRLFKKYSLKDLSEEDIVSEIYTYEQIFYIFRISYFSSYAWELVNSNKMSIGLICTLIIKNAVFQDADIQNRILQQVMEGKLKKTDIQNLNSLELRRKAGISITSDEREDFNVLLNKRAVLYTNRLIFFLSEYSDKLTESTKKELKERLAEMEKSM